MSARDKGYEGVVDQTTYAILGCGKITSLSTAKTLANAVNAVSGAALGIPAGTLAVLIVPETQAIRWLANSEVPTASLGVPLAPGYSLRFNGDDMTKVQLIEQAASATVWVVFLG